MQMEIDVIEQRIQDISPDLIKILLSDNTKIVSVIASIFLFCVLDFIVDTSLFNKFY